MKKIKILLIIFSITIFCLVLFFWNYFPGIYSKLSDNLPKIEKGVTGLIQETGKQISTPPPLINQIENPQSYLTRAGVIKWTNSQRVKYGLPPLKESSLLDETAKKKVDDMFFNQYFAHESPSGLSVADLANNTGYQFIAIGENLALGNFKDDEDLVQAWMDSPGHRENILNRSYQEIGVSVIQGTFEGKTTWLAVQHFGLPLSVCPGPDELIKSKIDGIQNQIKTIENLLNNLLEELQKTKIKRGTVYSQKVEEYNSLASQYNTLIEQAKLLTNQYNNQVNLFNECVNSLK